MRPGSYQVIDAAVEKRLRSRAHVHSNRCFGRYEPCGEHHLHDDTCGGRPLICGQYEDKDLVQLLAEFDRSKTEVERLRLSEESWNKEAARHDRDHRAHYVERERLRAMLVEALDGWDRVARALADDPHHEDERRITELREDI